MRQKGTKKHGFRRVLRGLLLFVTLLLTAFVLFLAVSVFSLDAWHEFDPERITDSAQTLIVYDMDDIETTRLHSKEDRTDVALEDIPYLVRMAFISAEDARFYDHIGVDFIRILGAAWADIKAGGYVQGASTISQQLIKLSHLTSEKTISRKLEEAVLACQMEQRYTKDEILNMYLNYVYFGGGYYGIEAAARGYFGVSASELTVPQAAMLAGILKSPSKYAPHIDLEASLSRRDNILGLMCEYGYISESERDEYREETPVILHTEISADKGYYVNAAMADAKKLLDVDTEELLTGGYRIYTFMDADIQAYCEEMFSDETLFPAEDVQAAIVVQRASGGGVAALIGGRGSDSSGFNRAVSLRRQPGSLIKPVIAYAPALESGGYTAATVLNDEKTDFAGYSPDNFNNKYYGAVTLREAVTRSLNIPAVTVLSDIGVDAGMEFASKVGIEFTDGDRSLALALGGFTYGVSPMQMAGAYAAFASGGVYSSPALIRRITDAHGEVLYEYEPEERRVMSEGNAYILTSMLNSVVNNGTGRRLGELNIPLAGKTGTVGDELGNRDAWMAAYNVEYSAAVWMGYDTSRDGQYLANEATGGNYPARVLTALYGWLYTDGDAPEFTAPDSVKTYRLDAHSMGYGSTLLLANGLTPEESVYTEAFVDGTEPTAESTYWTVPAGVKNLTVSLNGNGQPEITFTATAENARHTLYREDEYGNVIELKTWTGAGTYSLVDDAAEYARSYSYWVQPVHIELTVNGRRVTGASSRKLSVTLGAPPVLLSEMQIDIWG